MCVYFTYYKLLLISIIQKYFLCNFFTRIHTSKNVFENWSASLKIIFYSSFPLFVVRSHTFGSG